MEQELDDDLCVLNLHHLVLIGRIARQLVSQMFMGTHGKPASIAGLHHEGGRGAAEDEHALRIADRNGLYSRHTAHIYTGAAQNGLDLCLHLCSCLT